MSDLSVFGAGAFGTALAVSLAHHGLDVQLVARDAEQADKYRIANENTARLPGIHFPDGLSVVSGTSDPALICLLAVPTQVLPEYLAQNKNLFVGRTLVACCKGIDLETGAGATETILRTCPTSEAAVLSGPSFAIDIANGLPTALTVASKSDATARFLQASLSTSALRLYRSTDTIGVELGGALKNVVAIAAGITIGAGLGESARAAIMTRGYEELKRFALARGAGATTLSGLSGFGDLVLTSMSTKSRNYCHGLALGAGNQAPSATVEGIATAQAVAKFAALEDIDMPITVAVSQLLAQNITVKEAIDLLLSRPLKEE